jgi:predicted DCC family thiol-disulfide oxidoreductase YuxK
MEELKHEIIIYDGVCVLCNFFIRWILKKDQNFNFKVTNLQSNFTKTNYIEVTKVDSVAVILKDGGILQKSKAVAYILKKIKRLLLIRLLLIVFPSFLSNFIYDLIAKSRYLLFGKFSSCPVLVGDLKSRIIE